MSMVRIVNEVYSEPYVTGAYVSAE
jgi:hypothetical protein